MPERIDPTQVPERKTTQIAEIKRVSESMDSFARLLEKDPDRIKGIPTRYWKLFNNCFGGLRPELIVVTAETGNGKSTFARNWFQDCIHQNIASCLFSLEEGIMSVMHRFAQMEIGKKSHTFNKEDFRALGQTLETYPFYYVDWTVSAMIPAETLFNTIEYGIEKFGIKFFVIDHLDYVAKTHSWSNNESYVIGDFLRNLARIAHEKDVTIVLVVHPSKLSVQGNKRREVGIDDLKGSSSIKQEADAVFSLYRESKGNQETTLRFLKIRNHLHSKYQYTAIRFNFDDVNLRFEELRFEGGIDEV